MNDKSPSPPAGGTATALAWILLVVAGFASLGTWRSIHSLQKAAAEAAIQDRRVIAELQQKREWEADGGSPVVPGNEKNGEKALKLIADLVSRNFLFSPARGERPTPINTGGFRIDREGNLPSGFARFFGLDAGRQERLQRELTAITQEAEAALRTSTIVRRDPDGSVVLDARPNPSAQDLRERYVAQLRSALGDSHYGIFVTLNSPASPDYVPASDTNLFVQEHFTYTVKKSDAGYTHRIAKMRPDGTSLGGGGGSSGSGIEGMREALLRDYGPVMKLLPPDF